jgi:acyl-coenzyme A thioesterase PaaI-like protein
MDGGIDELGHGPSLVTEGEFAGWQTWSGNDAFEDMTGPFFFRVQDDGTVLCAFRAAAKHMNGGGAMHGGCMLTFADFSLFAIGREALKDTHSVTVSLNGEFIGPAFEGDLIECRGEVIKAGGSLIFMRGLVSTGGKPMLSYSGVVKKIRKR